MTTKREAKIALTKTWDDCRNEILYSIAMALAERMPGQWVSVTSVLPQGIPSRSWRSLWKNAMEIGMRATEYVPVEGHYLLRHKFGNSYFVWCIPRSDFSGELDTLVDRATTVTPHGSVPGITELQHSIDSKCDNLVEKLNKAREEVKKAVKTPPTRKRSLTLGSSGDALANKIRKCQTTTESLAEFQKMSYTEQEAAFSKLVEKSNELNTLKEEFEKKMRDKIQKRFWDHPGAIDFMLASKSPEQH